MLHTGGDTVINHQLEAREVISQPAFLNQVAVVTGASSGIGRATALELARRGAHLSLAARGAAALQVVAREIEALGREALVTPTDVTKPDDVRGLMRATLDRWGRIDILVASAGLYVRAPVWELSAEPIERSMSVNFYGSFHPIMEVLPHMRERGRGHIVLVSSMDAKKGLPLDAPYVAAKFAITGFAEVLRQELHGSGVQVSSIFPGRVDTPMTASVDVPWISTKIRPETVARTIVRAIRRRRAEIILPPQALMLHYLNTLSPRLGDWAVRFLRLEGWEANAAWPRV